MRSVKKGATDQSVTVRVVDSTDGTPETGVAYNTAGVDLWYRREGGAKVSITEATLAAVDSAHSDGGFIHIGDGYCRLDLPDAAFATGANGVMVGGTFTGMVVIGCYVPLVDYDPQDTVRLGLTALPNAAADAAGGLPISDAGGLDLDAQKADVAAILVDTGTTLQGELDGIQADTEDIQTRLPAALVSGRMDSSVGAMAANVITAAATAADFGTEIAAAVWNALTSGMSTAGSIGKKLADWTIHSAADVWSVATRVLTANTNLNDPTAAAIADQVWEEALADHSGTVGSTAEQLAAAGAAGDPWDTTIPGAYGAGKAGKIVGDALSGHTPQTGDAYGIVNSGTHGNAALKTLIDAVDNFVDTEVAAIKAVTDNLATALELDGAVYRFTTNALEQAPSGGSATLVQAIGCWTKSGSTYYVSFVLIVNGAIIAGASLSSLGVTVYDEDGTDLTFSGSPTAHATGIVYASGTLTTAVTSNRPVMVKVTATYNSVAYSFILPGAQLA